MKRATIIALLCVAPALAEKPDFDVASMRRLGPSALVGNIVRVRPTKITFGNSTLARILRFAYSCRPFEIVGSDGKPWNELVGGRPLVYSLEAQYPEGTPDKRMRVMLQNLLAERLGVRTHVEAREFDALVFAAPTKVPSSIEFRKTPADDLSDTGFYSKRVGGSLQLTTTPITMALLLDRLSSMLGMPLIDETGYGERQFVVSWEMTNGPGIAGYLDGLRDSLFRMGFPVVRKKVRLEVRVVDAVNRDMVEN